MKNLLFILFFITTQFLFAQQDTKLPGIVVEQNSKFNTGKVNYLSNAQIKSVGANPQLSDANGKFTLVFGDKPTGNIAKIYALKNGFEIVNGEELKNAAVLGRHAPLKIIMCKEGQLYENQVVYYNIAEDAAKTSYDRQIAILQQEGNEKELLLAKLRLSYNQAVTTVAQANELLLQQLTSAVKQAKQLADKWITVNLDDQSEIYQMAFRAFMQKDIERALSILNSVDLEKRLAINAKEKLREETLVVDLETNINNRAVQIQQDINQCVFKAELHILNNEFTKAEEMYELALKYDNNPDLIFDFAVFLSEQKRYEKSEQRYIEVRDICRQLVVENSQQYRPELAIILMNLGNLYKDINAYSDAKLVYTEALQIYQELLNQDEKQYESDFAAIQMNLGNMYGDLDQYRDAGKAFYESYQIYKRLAEEKPELYEAKLATVSMTIGTMYRQINAYAEAETALLQALDIFTRLAKDNPEQYEVDIAMTQMNLGNVYYSSNAFAEAELNYVESLKVYKKLVLKNPKRYESDLANTLLNLGNMYYSVQAYPQAEKVYLQSLEIYYRLVEENPESFEPLLGGVLVNLGNIYSVIDTEKAQNAFYQALEIYYRLSEQNHQRYDSLLADALMNLGVLFYSIKDFEKAEAVYIESLDIYMRLAEDNPEKYEPDVAGTLMNLGNMYTDISAFAKADTIYLKSLEIYKRLADDNPQGYNIKWCQVLLNMTYLKKDLLQKNMDMRFKNEALALIDQANIILNKSDDSLAIVQTLIEHARKLKTYFNEITKEELMNNRN